MTCESPNKIRSELLAILFLALLCTCKPAKQDFDFEEFQILMTTVAEGWSTQNTDQALSSFHKDAIYVEPPSSQYFQGHEQLRPFFAQLTAAHKMEFHNLWFNKETQSGVGEYTFSYGRDTATVGLVAVELENGKIKFWREYQTVGPTDFHQFLAIENKNWQWHIGNWPPPKISEELSELEGVKYLEVTKNQTKQSPKLPLVIALHWMGATPKDFVGFVSAFKVPVRILFVQAPYTYESGYSFFEIEPANYYELGPQEKNRAILKEAGKLSKFIAAATKKYDPPIKPVIIGASQGGDLSYIFATKYKHLISTACPLLATLDQELMQSTGQQIDCSVPIQVFHGTNDSVVSIESVRSQVNYLKTRNCQVTLNVYAGCGHEISKEMQQDYMNYIHQVIQK